MDITESDRKWLNILVDITLCAPEQRPLLKYDEIRERKRQNSSKEHFLLA